MTHEFLSATPAPPAIRNAMARALDRKQKGLPVYDFSSGNVGNLPLNLPLFTGFEIEINNKLTVELKTLAEGVADGLLDSYYPQPRALAYSPTGGTELITTLVTRYFKEVHGVPISDKDLSNVIVTAGGQQAMTAALRALKPTIKVLLLRWEYAPVPGILRDHGLKSVRIKVHEDFSIDLDDLEKKASKHSVFYISMPNNPTGYFSPKDFNAVTGVMLRKEGGVIWDAPYLFTILKLTSKCAKFDNLFLQAKLAELRMVTQNNYDNLCILSSLSKTCLIAGLRFGFATASSHWIKNMNAIVGRENLSSPTPSFIIGAEILRRFLANPTSHKWLCRVIANRLTILIEEVSDNLMLPGNGMFGALYVLLKTREEANKFANKLMEKHGIVTVPGTPFYGGPTDAVRLSLVSVPWSEGDEEWVKSVKTLKRALT